MKTISAMFALARKRRVLTVISIFFAFLLPVDQASAYIDGSKLIGRSGGPPRNRDCTGCHKAGAAIPQVSFSGPSTVAPGSINSYTFTITGGPAVNSGIEILASGGTLAPGGGDTLITSSGELSHVSPVAFAPGGVTYSFNLTAPASGTVTLYGAGLSTNGDGADTGDGTATASLAITVGGGAAPPPTPTPPTGGGGQNPVPPPAAGGLTAVIAGPSNGPAGVDLTFDAANSTVAGGNIVSYDWTLGDGTTATGVTAVHAFAAGNYVVGLQVTDATGASNTAQLGVLITPPGINSSPGSTLYDVNCSECHGPAGIGGPDGPPINNPPASAEAIADAIEDVAVMQPLATVLTEDDLIEIAAYLDSPTAATINANRFARSLSAATRGSQSTTPTDAQPLKHGTAANRVQRSSIDWQMMFLVSVFVALQIVGNRRFSRRVYQFQP